MTYYVIIKYLLLGEEGFLNVRCFSFLNATVPSRCDVTLREIAKNFQGENTFLLLVALNSGKFLKRGAKFRVVLDRNKMPLLSVFNDSFCRLTAFEVAATYATKVNLDSFRRHGVTAERRRVILLCKLSGCGMEALIAYGDFKVATV